MKIIFVHGTRSDSSVFEQQLQFVHQQGHQAIAIDLPGHGAFKQIDFDKKNAHQTITKAISELGEEKVVLVGVSLGGYVCLDYAAKYPERVLGVLATACATETRRTTTRLYKRATRALFMLHDKVRKNAQSMVESWKVVDQMLGVMSVTSLHNNLSRIFSHKTPVMMVSGQWCPLRFGERTTRRMIPFDGYNVIRGAGHDANLDAPESFNALLNDFLLNVR